MNRKLWDDILEAAQRGFREMRDGVGGRLRAQGRRADINRSRIEDTDAELAAGAPDAPATGPVQELDVGTYRDLRGRAVVGDAMQHDHIPSSAAIIRAREIELGRQLTRSERNELHQNAIAVELRDELHALSRTFRGRNTPTQIDLDAQDLAAAARRDYDTLRTNLTNSGDYTADQIDAVIDRLRTLNATLGR